MRCELNDLCYIRKAIRKNNIGLVVTCKEYLGYYLQGDVIEINGERWLAIVSDNFWVIENKNVSIETMFGKSREAFLPDLWLTPIKADGLTDGTKTETKIEDTVDA